MRSGRRQLIQAGVHGVSGEVWVPRRDRAAWMVPSHLTGRSLVGAIPRRSWEAREVRPVACQGQDVRATDRSLDSGVRERFTRDFKRHQGRGC